MKIFRKISEILESLIESLTIRKIYFMVFINILVLMSVFFAIEKLSSFMPRESYKVVNGLYNNRSVNLNDNTPKELRVATLPQSINEVDIQFNMKLFSTVGSHNAFQTADDNRGIRFELDPASRRMGLVVGSNQDFSVFWMPKTIEEGRDYNVRFNIVKSKVKIFLDGEEVLSKFDSSLRYEVEKVIVGSGYSQRRPFDGEISDYVMSYGAMWEPLAVKIFKGFLFLTLSLLLALIFLHHKVFVSLRNFVFPEKTNDASAQEMLKWYKSTVIEFLKDAKYVLPLLFSAAVGFSFTLTHLSIGADDTSVDRYFDGEYLLAQNRVTGYIVNRVLHVYAVKPFVPDFLSVLLLIVSALIFSAVFKKISKNKLHPLTYTIFTCLFISYPLIFQIFIVMGANLNICLGYLLTSISILFVFEFLEKKRSDKLFKSAVILYFALSCYESFAAVYLCALTSILTLKYLFGDEEDKQIGRVVLNGLILFIPLFAALVIYKVVGSILSSYIHLPNYAATGIAWASNAQTLYETFVGLWKGIALKFILSGFIFQPITSLVIAMIGSVVLAVFYAIKYKKIVIVLIILAMLLSIISLSILQGYATFYRSCQVFSFFTAFVLSLMLHQVINSNYRKHLKNSALILVSILVFRQANDLNNWFFVDYMRSEEEKTIANSIAYQVKSRFDINKPVIFTGGNGISDNINSYLTIKPDSWNGKIFNSIASRMMGYDMSGYKFVEGDMVPVYSWAIGAFGEVNTELLKYFKMNGHTFRQGTMEMFVEAIENSKRKPVWPAKGAIFETPTYIVVHL